MIYHQRVKLRISHPLVFDLIAFRTAHQHLFELYPEAVLIDVFGHLDRFSERRFSKKLWQKIIILDLMDGPGITSINSIPKAEIIIVTGFADLKKIKGTAMHDEWDIVSLLKNKYPQTKIIIVDDVVDDLSTSAIYKMKTLLPWKNGNIRETYVSKIIINLPAPSRR